MVVGSLHHCYWQRSVAMRHLPSNLGISTGYVLSCCGLWAPAGSNNLISHTWGLGQNISDTLSAQSIVKFLYIENLGAKRDPDSIWMLLFQSLLKREVSITGIYRICNMSTGRMPYTTTCQISRVAGLEHDFATLLTSIGTLRQSKRVSWPYSLLVVPTYRRCLRVSRGQALGVTHRGGERLCLHGLHEYIMPHV